MCVDFETDARLPLKIWVCNDGNAAPSGKSSAAALWTGMLANVFGTSLQADVLCLPPTGRLNKKTGCKLSVTYREGNMKQMSKISRNFTCFDYNNCTFDASVEQALSLVHTVHLSKLLFYLTSPWWQKKKSPTTTTTKTRINRILFMRTVNSCKCLLWNNQSGSTLLHSS